MEKPSDYFKKLDLAHLDANTAQFIREKVLTLPNIDILEGTKEFETLKAIIEENFPRAIGIEPVVIEPIIEVIPEVIIEEVIAPVIDTKQIEIDSITTQVSEMSDLIELMNEVVAENKDDLDSKDILELYSETLADLKDKLSKLSVVILDAIEEVKENIDEVKEIIKTDVIDTKGILTAPKKYKTEDGEEVLGYESDWNFGLNNNLGETVVYYVSNEDDKDKYSVLTGILHKGELIYSIHKTSNKEFENYSENVDDALKLAYELANDKDMVDKFENGGEIVDKFYYEQHGIGKAKYTVSYHDGVQKHKDGSPFYGIKTFKNKKDLNEFISKLNKEGYKYKNDSYTTKYVAVHESKDGYWTIASKPSSKENAEAMLGGTPKNEVGKVVTLEEARAHKKIVGEEYLYEKGGSLKSFNPESLIGYSIFGKHESSTIVGVKEISKDNVRLERKSNVGGLKYDSSFTLKELKDLYSGNKVGQYEAFKQFKDGGKISNEIVLNEGYGIVINKLYNKWQKIKTKKEHDAWSDLVKKTKFGTYGTIGIFEVLEKFEPKFPNEILKRDFTNELKKALGVSKDAYVKFENGGEVGDNKHTYMMLGRLQMDNDYFLGNGNRGERNLWAGNVDGQIEEMKKLWNSLPENGKPEWLSMEDILDYERKMKGIPSDSDKDENIAKIRFNDQWKTVQLFIDGSLYGEFNSYQDAVNDAKNNNSKVIIEDDVTMLNISESSPLSNQLVKLTGEPWSTSDFVNLDGGNNLTTSKPFKQISTGKIFEVVQK